MTIKEATKLLRSFGMTLKHVNREYRVNFRNGTEDTACYETDLESAIDTARAMARHHSNNIA